MQSDAKNKASFKDVVLNGANIAGQIAMTGANFDGKLYAISLEAGRNRQLMHPSGYTRRSPPTIRT
jgi:hypothetical protein